MKVTTKTGKKKKLKPFRVRDRSPLQGDFWARHVPSHVSEDRTDEGQLQTSMNLQLLHFETGHGILQNGSLWSFSPSLGIPFLHLIKKPSGPIWKVRRQAVRDISGSKWWEKLQQKNHRDTERKSNLIYSHSNCTLLTNAIQEKVSFHGHMALITKDSELIKIFTSHEPS